MSDKLKQNYEVIDNSTQKRFEIHVDGLMWIYDFRPRL